MSLPSEQSSVTYVGNNSDTTPYPIPYLFYTDEDIVVTVTDVNDVSTVLVLGVDYAVTGGNPAAGSTGSLTTAVAIPVTSDVTIDRTLEIIQSTVFTDLGRFPSASVDRAYDYLTMVCQQIQRSVTTIFCTAPEAVAGVITNKAVSPASLLVAIQAAAFTAGSYLMATLAQAVAAISSTTVISPASLGWVLRPEFHADATDAGIRAAAAFAAVGGGVVMVPAGVITLSSPLPILSGVIYQGAGHNYFTNNNVGTRLVGDGTFNCFEHNPTDGTTPPVSQPAYLATFVEMCGARGFTIDNFLNGVKAGALYVGGIGIMDFADLHFHNCTGWGSWLENCQFGELRNIFYSGNIVGAGMFVDSGSSILDSGNYKCYNLIGLTPLSTSRGLVFEGRKANSILNDVHVFGGGMAGTGQTYTTSAQTITNGASAIPFPDLSKIVVNQGVIFATAVGGISAGPSYFVLSKSASTGAGTITISAKKQGSTIVPNAGGSSVIKTAGCTNMEVGGSEGGQVWYSTFHALDLENPGTCALLFQDCIGVRIETGITGTVTGFNTVTARNVSYSNWLSSAEGYVMGDYSSDCQFLGVAGQQAASYRTSIQGVGVYVSRGTPGGVLSLSGNGDLYYDTNTGYLRWARAFRVNGESHGAGNTINPNQGMWINVTGNQTLPPADAAHAGVILCLSNSTSSPVTISTQSGALIDALTGVTSIVIAPKCAVILICQTDNSIYYWARFCRPGSLDVSTVAALPSAVTLGAGAMRHVTDANATTRLATVAGGGSNSLVVFSDGTNWVIL